MKRSTSTAALALKMSPRHHEDAIDYTDLDMDEAVLLGKGAFGTVHVARWRETPVAVKTAHDTITDFQKMLFTRELDTLTRLRHPNIVQFLGFVVEPFCIALEYLPNSDLRTFCAKARPNYTHKLRISIDILRGLAYLHNRKPASIIHRDIKPTNVLITPSGTAKISDFGLAKMAQHAQQDRDSAGRERASAGGSDGQDDLSCNVGTVRYMAPEARSETYTCAVDIFSAGATLYELFEGCLFAGVMWALAPDSVRPPIVAMCAQKPESRPTAIECIERFEAMQESRAKGYLHRVLFASRSNKPARSPKASPQGTPHASPRPTKRELRVG